MRRTPSGVRGLKSRFWCRLEKCFAPHPVRGAWIEISYTDLILILYRCCRTPSGVRGLKYAIVTNHGAQLYVAPRQGCVD